MGWIRSSGRCDEGMLLSRQIDEVINFSPAFAIVCIGKPEARTLPSPAGELFDLRRSPQME
jgi:hypothetical protein